MVDTPSTLSASERVQQLIPTSVEVGGRTLKVKRTGKALKKIVQMSEPQLDEEGNEKELSGPQYIDVIYEQLASLLRDEENREVDPAWLEEELDFEVASEWISRFVPTAGEGKGSERQPADGSGAESSTTTSTLEPEPAATEA